MDGHAHDACMGTVRLLLIPGMVAADTEKDDEQSELVVALLWVQGSFP